MENTMFGNLMNFELPKEKSSIIKVIGVGGGGTNAVNHMFNFGIRGVDFVVCNTDAQSLLASPIPIKIQLGADLTEGRGAGSIPEVGKNAAIENLEDVRTVLSNNTKMVFITAGMGGGTGTGAAPIIAQAAREMGVLTVGIVTMPFMFEGRKRREQAEKGLEELRKHVDTLLVISNEKLRDIYGNLTMSAAFAKADDVLSVAAKSIAEIITVSGHVNVDFADVRTVMTDGGNAIMGSAVASGEGRSLQAVENAMASPLLNDNCIKGARYVLLYISYGSHELGMDEMSEITDYVQDEAGQTADIIWGSGFDESLGEGICVTVIATGFTSNRTVQEAVTTNKVTLEIETPAPVAAPPAFSIETEIKLEDRSVVEPVNVVQQPVVEDKPQTEYIALSLDETPQLVNEAKPDLDLFKPEDNNTEPLFKPVQEVPSKADEFFQPITDKVPLASFDNKVNTNTGQEKSREDLFRQNERMLRLKEISHKLKSPSGLKDLESEPAFKRRNLKLEENNDDTQLSKSSFSVDEDGVKIVRENRFLHGNVD